MDKMPISQKYILLASLFGIFICFVEADDSLNSTIPCKLADGADGACVALTACSAYAQLLKEGNTTLQGLQLVQKYQCGFEELNAKVCCPLSASTGSSDRFAKLLLRSNETAKLIEEDFAEALPEHSSCKLEDGAAGACVALTACSAYAQLLKEGNTTLQGLQLVQKYQCGLEELNAKVCCPLPASTGSSDRLAKLLLRSDESSKLLEEDFAEALPEPPHCGHDVNGQVRLDCEFKLSAVLNGKPAYGGITRWMALLGYKDAALFWQCGGTIITTRHVLTAAHCIKDNLYLVRVGEIDYIYSSKYNSSPADYLIKRAIKHEEYANQENDIGLLITQEHIQFNEFVAPICLPLSNVSYTTIEVGVNTHRRSSGGVIEGWGVTENGTSSSRLLYAKVKTIPNENCSAVYPSVNLDERVLCAGARGTDSCKGDSGGPLVYGFCIPDVNPWYKDWYYQVGIVSKGYHCHRSKFVGIYTKVEYFMPWLEEKVLGKRR